MVGTRTARRFDPAEWAPRGFIWHIAGDHWVEAINPRWTNGQGLAIIWKGEQQDGPFTYLGSMGCDYKVVDFQGQVTRSFNYNGY